MTAQPCVRCERPTLDGYACSGCADRAAAQLAEIRELTPAARDVAYGIVRRSAGGSGSGKPGSRSPGNDDAMDTLDEVQNRLTTLARDIAEMRGAQFVSTAFDGLGVPDPLAEACSWLGGQMEWARHAVDGTEPYAMRALDEIAESARQIRHLVDGPAAQKYLGPCGAEVEVEDDFDYTMLLQFTCDGDVYGRAGGDKGRCRTCGAEVDTGERLIWLDDVRRDWLYYASEIADAYPIKAMTIRAWLSRGLLVAHGDRDGRPLLKLGEVLDLAAGDAARREEARATRARRSAARAAESETAA